MAQTADTIRHEVLLETSKGNIRIALYNETPQHRDNFIRLTQEGFYDGLLFHRVISRFMIQGGDPADRQAPSNSTRGGESSSNEGHKSLPTGEVGGAFPTEDAGETIPAEIRYPALFHKRGVVAAAREGDDVNPERSSSASQFYIVYGKRFNDEMLDDVQKRLDRQTNGEVKLTEEIREAYKKYGGTPHLDGQYTVFGEVVEGLDVVNEIQWVETDENDRPKEDIMIIKARVIK